MMKKLYVHYIPILKSHPYASRTGNGSGLI